MPQPSTSCTSFASQPHSPLGFNQLHLIAHDDCTASSLGGTQHASTRPHALGSDPITHAGALQEALDDYNSVLRLEPRNVDALYHRGTVYEKLGCLDEAIHDFTAVLTLDPNHVKAGYARGACRNLKGEFFEAIGEQLVMGCPGIGRVYGVVGLVGWGEYPGVVVTCEVVHLLS